MSKTTSLKRNEVVVVGRKQQLSKILMGQLKAEIKRSADNRIESLESVEDSKEFNSTAHHFIHDTLGSFGTSGVFELRIVKRYGMRKVIYANSNGLISAIYSTEEFGALQQLVGDYMCSEMNRVNRIVAMKQLEQDEERLQHKITAEVEKQLRAYDAAHKCSGKPVHKGRPSSVTDPGYMSFTEMAEKQDIDDGELY
jgi:hypothetical protein